MLVPCSTSYDALVPCSAVPVMMRWFPAVSVTMRAGSLLGRERERMATPSLVIATYIYISIRSHIMTDVFPVVIDVLS